jgi:diaminopimelate epimerase
LIRFAKYHALSNDYLVLDPKEGVELPSPEQVRAICERHRGIGADGILYGPLPGVGAAYALRIFNPDGSEAEKSGNGLRIFLRYLYDQGRIGEERVEIETAGGMARGEALEGGRSARVEMGRVSFWSDEIPVTGERREVLDERIQAGGRGFRFCAASLGNPHCVILGETPTPELAQHYGPRLEQHAWFPRRTNVQFVEVVDGGNLRVEVWERGAGYTLASGSSACAAAAAAHRLGLCAAEVDVHMPGGGLQVRLDAEFNATLTGAVTRVAHGWIELEGFD